jgi:hypothetical protein
MSADAVDLHAARRALRNFRAMVRRPSNWSGALEGGYSAAFFEQVRLEDRHGVDAIPAELYDRLRALRQEAGLTPEEVIRAEQDAIAAADRDRERSTR